MHDDEFLGAVDLDREGRARPCPDRLVGPLDGEFDVLRVVVAALHDDDVLDTADDVQMAALQEAEIAGAQEGRGPFALDTGPEGGLAGLGAAPVPVRHAAARDPDLTDVPLGVDPPSGAGVDDGDVHPVDGGAAADQPDRPPAPRPGCLGRGCVGHGCIGHGGVGYSRVGYGFGDPRAQGGGRERADRWRFVRADPRHHQRRLREAVAGQQGTAFEAAGREPFGELVEGVGAYRLGAVQRQPPVAQVKPVPLLVRDPAYAVLEAEVGGDAGGRPGPRQRLQPQQRLPYERHRGHEVGGKAAVQGREDAADETHVVVRGQPGHHARPGVVLQPAVDRTEVVQQVAVADHHALGRRGRAGRVLEEGRRIAPDHGLVPGVGSVGAQLGQRQPAQTGEPERVHLASFRGREARQGPGREGVGGPGVPGDGRETGHGLAEAPGVRRVGGYGDGSRVQAAEEAA